MQPVNPQHRYRITGSIFLLAMLVIFVPMLFDADGVNLQPPNNLSNLSSSQPQLASQSPQLGGTGYDDVVPATDVVERVQQLGTSVDEDGFHTSHGTRFGEPRLFPVSAGTTMWAVQAASFANLENARNFRNQIRGEGFEAFISSVKANDKVMHRVAVGPLLNKVEAANINAQISTKFSVQAQLMEVEL